MKVVLQIGMFTLPIFFALFMAKGRKESHWIKLMQFILYFILVNGSVFCISHLRGVKKISFYNMTYSYCMKWMAAGMVFAIGYSIGMNYIWSYLYQKETKGTLILHTIIQKIDSSLSNGEHRMLMPLFFRFVNV